jgi:hypothetical protein
MQRPIFWTGGYCMTSGTILYSAEWQDIWEGCGSKRLFHNFEMLSRDLSERTVEDRENLGYDSWAELVAEARDSSRTRRKRKVLS